MRREPETISDVVTLWVESLGGASVVAKEFNIHVSSVFGYMSGKIKPPDTVLKAIGFRKVELYIPDEIPTPRVGYEWGAKVSPFPAKEAFAQAALQIGSP